MHLPESQGVSETARFKQLVFELEWDRTPRTNAPARSRNGLEWCTCLGAWGRAGTARGAWWWEEAPWAGVPLETANGALRRAAAAAKRPSRPEQAPANFQTSNFGRETIYVYNIIEKRLFYTLSCFYSMWDLYLNIWMVLPRRETFFPWNSTKWVS
jgi:hypothetical protein